MIVLEKRIGPFSYDIHRTDLLRPAWERELDLFFTASTSNKRSAQSVITATDRRMGCTAACAW